MGWARGIALAVCAVTTASCIDLGSHSCTSEYQVCNQTTITLQSPNDAWTAGTYTLAMIVDGASQQCTMQIPAPPPVGGVQGSCGLNSTVILSLVAVDSCPPVVCDTVACRGSSCTPIAGRFQMALTIGGPFGFAVRDAQPPHVVGQLGLDLSVDGNELMRETIAPKVTTTGSQACGTCTNASATLSIAGG